MAFCFAVLSGVLGVAMLTQMDRRIRSRRRLRTLAGLDAIAAVPRVPRSVGYGAAWQGDPLWPLAVGAIRAAIGRSSQAEPQRRIGILGSTDGRGASRLAADLADLVDEAEPPDAADAEAIAPRLASERAHMTVLALPTLDASAEVRAELAAMDAAILVIEADRTTVDEVGIALRALRDSNVRLAGTLLTR